MRLYLSSFRVGNHADRLLDLLGGKRRVAVIANAMDAASDEVRRESVQRELTSLTELGLECAELDLRDYFTAPDRLATDLREYDAVWLRGGNCFLLRYVLARSGADQLFRELLHKDAIVYAGYSAGPCVLSPTLQGFQTVDTPDQVEEIYAEPPLWAGLAVLDFTFVPHVASPGHPETDAMQEVIAYLRAEGLAYRTLRDGDVLVVEGDTTHLYD